MTDTRKYLPPTEYGVSVPPGNPLREPTECMVDLETLGTDPYAPILSIGACTFSMDDEPITDMFYQAVTLESCLQLGMRPAAATMLWWMQQERDAQQAAFFHAGAVPLPNALDAFTTWLNSRPLNLWGNSARFDLGLLEAAYKSCGKEPPWRFWDERCYRTVKNMPNAKEIPLVRFGTHHNAAHDAVSQALHLRAISKKLQLHL